MTARESWREWPCTCDRGRPEFELPVMRELWLLDACPFHDGSHLFLDDAPDESEFEDLCDEARLADALIDNAVAMVELYRDTGAWAGCQSDPLSEKPEVHSRQWYETAARALGVL